MNSDRHGDCGYDYFRRRGATHVVEDIFRQRVRIEAVEVWNALYSSAKAKSKSQTFEIAEGKFRITIKQVD